MSPLKESFPSPPKSHYCKRQMNATIQRALESQGRGDGDRTVAPTFDEVYDSVLQRFHEPMREVNEVHDRAFRGNEAVINELLVSRDLSPQQKSIVKSFFGAEALRDTSLGSKVSSFVLQLDKSLLPKKAGTDHPMPPPKTISRPAASCPARFPKRCLTIGDTETDREKDRVQNLFEDSRALKLILLLHRLLNTPYWQEISTEAFMPFEFDVAGIDLESNAVRALKSVQTHAEWLLEGVMAPALGVHIGSSSGPGGQTDISVTVTARDQGGSPRTKHMAVIELKKPSSAYRVAYALAFGKALEQEDAHALQEPINPSKVEKLAHTRTQLEDFSNSRLKHTVHLTEDEPPRLVQGYTCIDRNGENGRNVTATLRSGYLKPPLDALHVGLEQAFRYSVHDLCRNMGASEGFTIICTHLRDFTLSDRYLEVNFNSHYALDLTAPESKEKFLNYLLNTARESEESLRYIQILTGAAWEHFGSGEITRERSKEFSDLVNNGLANYKFHSDEYFKATGLEGMARTLTEHRVPIIHQALAQFAQEFGAIAECGEYVSSNFHVLQYFRVNAEEGIPTSENEIPGRSRSVAKVNFVGIAGTEAGSTAYQNPCVLKIYDAYEASIARMERELKAYHRVAQLAESDQQRVAKLLAFGAIDLEGNDPRLFILIEYVEDSPAGEPPYREQELEIERVSGALESVGVHHNDLAERNFKWQVVGREWMIKVFDFDHATFDDYQPLDIELSKTGSISLPAVGSSIFESASSGLSKSSSSSNSSWKNSYLKPLDMNKISLIPSTMSSIPTKMRTISGAMSSAPATVCSTPTRCLSPQAPYDEVSE